jgi:hypothetical protein
VKVANPHIVGGYVLTNPTRGWWGGAGSMRTGVLLGTRVPFIAITPTSLRLDSKVRVIVFS